MRKLLMIAAATSVLATPAMAQDWQGKTYGQDAIGWYKINASVNSFCKFGTSNAGVSGLNGSAVAGAPGTTAEADGTFTLDIQNDNDDTVQAASAGYVIEYAVCNSPFDMRVTSTNGGLKSSATTSDPEFTELVPYSVLFRFDGIGSPATPVAVGAQTVGTSPEARAGEARIQVRVAAQDDLLIQGTYSDFLVAELIPNLGS